MACGGTDTGDNGGEEIALLLPERRRAVMHQGHAVLQGEAADAVRRLRTRMIYQNAQAGLGAAADAGTGRDQSGGERLVLDPVDGKAAAGNVAKAKAANIPVISYDRLILGTPTSTTTCRSTMQRSRASGNALLTALGTKDQRAAAGCRRWLPGRRRHGCRGRSSAGHLGLRVGRLPAWVSYSLLDLDLAVEDAVRALLATALALLSAGRR